MLELLDLPQQGHLPLELVRRRRKCLFFYFYYLHPELGFCHVRLQSWFPFEVQVRVNGREALSRALERKGVRPLRYANAILKVSDWDLAQRLADRLATRRWPRLLNGLARQVNPMLATVVGAGFGGYWWVVARPRWPPTSPFAPVRLSRPCCPASWRTRLRPSRPRTCCASSGASCTLRWPRRSPATPGAAPKGGESTTAWPATPSRSTTRPACSGWRPPSTTPPSSASCA